MDKQPADLNRSDVVMGHAEFHPYDPIWMTKSIGVDHIEKQELAPVKHGRWIRGPYVCGEYEFKCSACGETEWHTSKATPYCPQCGAKMDGGSGMKATLVHTGPAGPFEGEFWECSACGFEVGIPEDHALPDACPECGAEFR